MKIKKDKISIILFVIAIIIIGVTKREKDPATSSPVVSAINNNQVLVDAFRNRRSNLQVQGAGTVVKVLPDDTQGSKHQKFILKVTPKQTVLIAHNIDLAPRVASLKEGDTVEFCGEYEWSHQGGVIHWTHHDPGGRHKSGWLQHGGKTYK